MGEGQWLGWSATAGVSGYDYRHAGPIRPQPEGYHPPLPNLDPAGLGARYGLTEGSIFHGEMGLDQLMFMRPVPGYGQYRTPIDRLYLCGAGTHPGGGVTGAPGYNAAREILSDLKR